MSKYITFRKNGKFYNCVGDDALILNYLFNYKIVNDKVGFPETAMNKVFSAIENNKISYVIIENDTTKKHIIKRNNKYEDILIKSKSNMDLNNKVNIIESNLRKLDEERLNIIIDIFYSLSNMDTHKLNKIKSYFNE